MAEAGDNVSLSIIQRVGLLGVYVLFGALSLLPLSCARAIGSGLGILYYKLASKRVKIVRTNLKLCFPELNDVDRELVVRRSFAHIGMWIFESGAIWLWSTKRILELVEVDNQEVFENALRQGHGVVLAFPHLGNWEILGPYATRHSDFACFYQRIRAFVSKIR